MNPIKVTKGVIIYVGRAILFERFLVLNLLVEIRRVVPQHTGFFHPYLILHDLLHLQQAYVV
jgi:hypothetical protein